MPRRKVEVYQKDKLLLIPKKVKIILEPKKITPFAKSGAYIPISGEYKGLMAYIIVLKKGVKK